MEKFRQTDIRLRRKLMLKAAEERERRKRENKEKGDDYERESDALERKAAPLIRGQYDCARHKRVIVLHPLKFLPQSKRGSLEVLYGW